MVAGVALEQEPQALLLLVSPADESAGKKGQQQSGVFLLAGNQGRLPFQDQMSAMLADIHSCVSIFAIFRLGKQVWSESYDECSHHAKPVLLMHAAHAANTMIY